MEIAAKSDSSSARNSNLCRVCLSENEDNKYIFTLHENLDHDNYSISDLSEKLQLYGGIKVEQDDGFPAKLCNECISKMSIAHGFRAQCQKTDKILRAAYKNYSTVECWKEDGNDATEREIGESYEHEKSEVGREESITSAGMKMEIVGTLRLSGDSEDEITSIGTNVRDCTSVSEKELCRIQKFNVREKMDSDKPQKTLSLHGESTIDDSSFNVGNSGSSFEETINKKSTEAPEPKEETLLSKKEGHRSRRFIVFKRMTSMQSLKNHKERQRQYIKKTAKPESNDTDSVQSGKDNCTDEPKILEIGSNRNYKKLSCDQCDVSFARLSDFLEHAESHDLPEKLRPATCEICNKSFRKAVTMVRHLNVHKRDNPMAVYSILKEIRDKRKLKSAENSIEGDKNVVIVNKKVIPKNKECLAESQNDQTSTLNTFNVDPKSLDERGVYHCEQCGKQYSSEKSLQIHILSHDKQIFECTICTKKIVSEAGLKRHTETCSTPLEPRNLQDDRSAIKLINIWIKEELESDNEGKSFPCSNCTKAFITKQSLLKHQAKMHKDLLEKQCRICGKDCICDERNKEIHDKHQEKSKTYSCEECNKTFEKEVKLEKHMRIHARAKEQQDANFKRFLCHICSKTFRQNTGLMFHMRTHTGYKPHVCKYCGRGFTSNSNCINHERTHTGDRPFVCHFCSAAFAKSCTLKAHITTHTGEANYHCKTCDKSFRRLKYLKEHRFTHTGEKPYACKICGTAYSHSGSLFVHEKKCKAQLGDSQSFSVPVTQNYCQNQTVAEEDSSVTIAPIIETLPHHHDETSIGNSLNPHENRHYADNVSRINAHCTSGNTGAQIHLNTINPDIPTAIRSFTIVGQMFHT